MNKIKVYNYNNPIQSFDTFDIFEYVDSPQNCDFIYFALRSKPKYDKIYEITETNVPIVKDVLEMCNKFNKYLVYVCIGDAPPVILPNKKGVFVYKTSIDTRYRFTNEFVLGVGVPDTFNGKYIEDDKLSIGFVGQIGNGRSKYLEYLEKSTIKTDFIKREMDFDKYGKEKAEMLTKEFFQNMENNLFIFCFRGRGNFSIRFYETLMMGRVPIVINTHNIYPYMDQINYNQVGLFVEETDLDKNMDLENRILEYYQKNKGTFLEIQQKNREIYTKYFYKNYMNEMSLEVKQRIHKEKNI